MFIKKQNKSMNKKIPPNFCMNIEKCALQSYLMFMEIESLCIRSMQGLMLQKLKG